MSAYLIAIPSNGRETLALYHDELPTWWNGRDKLHPGATLLVTLSAEEIAGRSLDELAAYARMSAEYR